MERNEPGAAAPDDGSGIPADMVEGGPEAAAAEGGEADSQNAGLARNLGWRPQEEYRGPKDKWIDADAFIAKVEKETPIMRERLRMQASENERLKQELAEFKREKDEGWSELVNRSRAAEERGWQYARETLKAKMRQAVADADTATFDRLEAELGEIEKMRPPAKPEKRPDASAPNNAPTVDPAVTEWLNENPWAKTSKMFSIAKGIEEDLLESKPHLSTRDRLNEVTNEMKRRFPEKFENSARSAPPAAARPGPQGARPPAKKAKTEADLPPSARAVMERLVGQKVLTKEQYLKDYKW